MTAAKDFFTLEEEQLIVNAITAAEKNTSGEIRVHIESHSEKPPLERAQEVFHLLDMDATTKDVVIEHFKGNRFAQGLSEGILRAGDRLKQYFPYTDGDTNELPNEISKG